MRKGDKVLNARRILLVAGFDSFFPSPRLDEAGWKFVKKCKRLIERTLHLLNPGDALLAYSEIDIEYLRYFESLYGFTPMVFAPRELIGDRLSLVGSTIKDRELTERIKAGRDGMGWQLSSLIQAPNVFDLAREVGLLTVPGMEEDMVRQDGTVLANDKAEFQKLCTRLGIPTPKSVHCRGLDEICAEAEKIFDQYGGIFFRLARAAGGLGNAGINTGDIQGTSLRAVLESLEPHDQWGGGQVVLVERVADLRTYEQDEGLPVINGFSVMGYAKDGHIVPQSLNIVDRMVDGGCSVGAVVPGCRFPLRAVNEAVEMTRKLVKDLHSCGYDGPFDVDWGMLRNEELVAFEMNVREVATRVQIAVAEKLFADNPIRPVTISDEVMRVGESLTLGDVIGISKHVEATVGNRVRVVITIPPSAGIIGIVIVGEDYEPCMLAWRMMREVVLK